MGGQLRAFTPIINSNGRQLGFVMASILTENLIKEKQGALMTIVYLSLVGLLIGIIGSLDLSKNIKSSLLGFEPEQISKLFLQRKEVLDTLFEGIIAIDENHKVTIFNRVAMEMIEIKNDFVIGNEIVNLVSNSRLPEIMKSGTPEYNKEMIINDTIKVVYIKRLKWKL
jgi:sensor histidine kinase regulating citrate/malate metabolism